MSLPEVNESINAIKLEVEKLTDSTDDKNDSNDAEVMDTNVDSINASSTNIESTEVSAEQDHDNTPENIVMEVPINEVRYFSGIGESDQQENNAKTNELPAENPSSPSVSPDVANSKSSPDRAQEKAGSSQESPPSYNDFKYGKVELYAPDVGPRIYNVKGNIITRPIIVKNLREVFKALPIYGKPESKAMIDNFYEQKLRDYMGYGLSDAEFAKLHEYMDPYCLQTGLERMTPYAFPTRGQLPVDLQCGPPDEGPGKHLCTVKKLQLRLKKDRQNHYPRKLKYRGLRMFPLSAANEDKEMASCADDADDADEGGGLEPGRDLIFRIRVYRPYSYGASNYKEQKPSRHSVFNNDVAVLGRQPLTALRDHIVCANDVSIRVDVSDNLDGYTTESAKQIFPSGFLFINNVFYVDRRVGCADHSAGVRRWARARGLGDFPVHDMAAVTFDQLIVRLGHPEVYIHQGKCEHLFTISEVRLLSATDPQAAARYPCYTQITQNQSVYCTTCAEFCAKWIVVGCNRVPFDPAFFCDTCLRFYLYDKEGNKIGDFKAYSYKGNTVNFLKPLSGKTVLSVEEPSDDEDSK